jgi:peroxiredoxin
LGEKPDFQLYLYPSQANRCPFSIRFSEDRFIRKELRMHRILISFSLLVFFLALTAGTGMSQYFEAGVEKLETPIEAPDFTLPVLTGGEISLKDLRGKIVLLNFFSPWCPVCQNEAASFDKLNEAMKEKGVVLLQIASEATEEQAINYKKEFKISLPILLDEDGTVGKAYRLFGLHETFFINREGKILGKAFEGGKEWTSPKMLKLIEYLLAEGK